jgi:hypothetical protein
MNDESNLEKLKRSTNQIQLREHPHTPTGVLKLSSGAAIARREFRLLGNAFAIGFKSWKTQFSRTSRRARIGSVLPGSIVRGDPGDTIRRD